MQKMHKHSIERCYFSSSRLMRIIIYYISLKLSNKVSIHRILTFTQVLTIYFVHFSIKCLFSQSYDKKNQIAICYWILPDDKMFFHLPSKRVLLVTVYQYVSAADQFLKVGGGDVKEIKGIMVQHLTGVYFIFVFFCFCFVW